MNELLIVFLILLISVFMFLSIMYILKADRKVLELNTQVTKFKETDFSRLKNIVSFFGTVNKYVRLGKIRQYFEITMTAFTTYNLVIILKKLWNKPSNKKV